MAGENKHIIEEAKLFLGTHKYLKWPTLFVLAVISVLLLSKQIGESVDYWLSKLKLVAQSTTKIDEPKGKDGGSNIAQGSQTTDSTNISKMQPPTTPKTASTAKNLTASSPSHAENSTPNPKITKSTDIKSSNTKDEAERASSSTSAVPKNAPAPAPAPAPAQSGDAEEKLTNKENVSTHKGVRSEVAVAIAALSGETTSDRIRSVTAMLPSIPSGLTAAEIIGLAGSETTSHREQILAAISKKIHARSIPGEDVAKILANETTSNRIRCTQIIEPFIRAPISGKSAVSILGDETYSHRVGMLKIIVPLIQRPLTEQDAQAILDGTSTSDRTQAIGLLLGSSPAK